jgi:hypothetical protein
MSDVKYTGFAAIYQIEQEKLKREKDGIEGPAKTAGPEIIAGPAEIASPANRRTDPRQIAGPAEIASPAKIASAAKIAEPDADILAGLPEGKGFLKLYYQLIDHLFPQLDPKEQTVYLHLYRLSWGFGKPTIFISNPRLASRTGMSVRGLHDVTNRLIGKKLLVKVRQVIEPGAEQGIEWSIAIPAGLAKIAGQENFAGQAKSAAIIDKDLKESNKREMAAPDYKTCPDCQGSGFWYPEGNEKGVAKCKHARLAEGE